MSWKLFVKHTHRSWHKIPFEISFKTQAALLSKINSEKQGGVDLQNKTKVSMWLEDKTKFKIAERKKSLNENKTNADSKEPLSLPSKVTESSH